MYGFKPDITDDQLISLCLDLMMAGSETTSNTLSYCVIYMILYPEVQKKVQLELQEVIGSRWPTLQDRFRYSGTLFCTIFYIYSSCMCDDYIFFYH